MEVVTLDDDHILGKLKGEFKVDDFHSWVSQNINVIVSEWACVGFAQKGGRKGKNSNFAISRRFHSLLVQI